jgi:hypothetical protein
MGCLSLFIDTNNMCPTVFSDLVASITYGYANWVVGIYVLNRALDIGVQEVRGIPARSVCVELLAHYVYG